MALSRRRQLDDLHDSSEDEAILFDGIDDSDTATLGPGGPTPHPVKSMQGPFDESLIDSMDQMEYGKAPLKLSNLTAEERWRRLLEDEEYNDTYNAKWKEDPDSKYHPLEKVVAQIAFGMHLLHKRLAASDEEVIRILQKHIDDVDEFVGRADEDLEMALIDIGERVNHLKVPLEHMATFEVLLGDRQYRLQTLEGNDNIERIVNKSAILMEDILSDLKYGAQAVQDMSEYFVGVGPTWPADTTSMGLYNAMLANTEGWLDWFDSLQNKGNMLGASLVQLGSFLNEIAKQAGIASRKQTLVSNPGSAKHSPNPSNARIIPNSRLSASSKPLPQDPDSLTRAMQETIPKARPRISPPKQSVEKSRNRLSTMTIKSQKISDKRASTQTIASLFHPPRDQLEKARKKSGKAAKSGKMGKTAMMKSMIPSMPKLPRPRRGSISEKFSFSMKTRMPSVSQGQKPSLSQSKDTSRPKLDTHNSTDMSRKPAQITPPLNQSHSPQISISTVPDTDNAPRSVSPQLNTSSSSNARKPELSIQLGRNSSASHKNNPSKSSTTDSLAPLSPISFASSTRPTSPASQRSVNRRVESPTMHQQTINISSSRERPRMVEVKPKTSRSDSPSLSSDSPTPVLPPKKFDPASSSLNSSRAASPAPIQERRIEIKRIGQMTGAGTPPTSDLMKTESPTLGVPHPQDESVESRSTSRSSSPNPVKRTTAEIVQKPAPRADSPLPTADDVSEDTTLDNIVGIYSNSPLLDNIEFPTAGLGLNISSEPPRLELSLDSDSSDDELDTKNDIPKSNSKKSETECVKSGPKDTSLDSKEAKSEAKVVNTESQQAKPEAKVINTESQQAKPEAKVIKVEPKEASLESKSVNVAPDSVTSQSNDLISKSKEINPGSIDDKSESKDVKAELHNVKSDSELKNIKTGLKDVNLEPEGITAESKDVKSKPENTEPELKDVKSGTNETSTGSKYDNSGAEAMKPELKEIKPDSKNRVVLKEINTNTQDIPLESKPESVQSPLPTKIDSPHAMPARKPLPPKPGSQSTVASFERSPVPEISKELPQGNDSPKKTPISKAQIRRVDSDNEPADASNTVAIKQDSPPRLTPTQRPDMAKLNVKKAKSPYLNDTLHSPGFAASMTDLHRHDFQHQRPSTPRSMKSGLRSHTKLALFPTPSPSMISLRAAQSEIALPLKDDPYIDEGIGEEADSALPIPAPQRSKPSGGGRMAVFRKLISFGRRRTVDVIPSRS